MRAVCRGCPLSYYADTHVWVLCAAAADLVRSFGSPLTGDIVRAFGPRLTGTARTTLKSNALAAACEMSAVLTFSKITRVH